MKKIETSRDALRDIAAVFPEILNLSVFQTILNRAPDDAAFERMEAAFQAEIDAHDPKDSDLGCDATDATLPVPRKTPDATPAPTLSTGTQTITIRIPAAILNSCRVQAKKSCIPYQTLIIRTLKAAAAEWVKPVSQLQEVSADNGIRCLLNVSSSADVCTPGIGQRTSRTTADQRTLIAIVSTHFATRFLNSAPYNFL